MKTKQTVLLATLALATSLAFAQDQAPQPPQGDRPPGNGRGNMEDFRKKMAERLKETLKVSDEEWGVIQPLVEKVQTKAREAGGGRFGPPRGGDRGSDRGGSPGGAPDMSRPGAAETAALRAALEDQNTSPETVKAKLTAVREQRKKAQAELAEAREELRKVLTVRQEAALVSFGILE
jgi:Spy/CpxP family protein refolding chaperone